MRFLPTIALSLLCLGIGYFAGRAGTRSAQRADPERRSAAARAGETSALERSRLAEENRTYAERIERLERRVEAYESAARDREAPKKGERLEDGSIVGGARWNDSFVRLSTGFLDSLIDGFIREAELTPEQDRRLRESVRTSAERIMQVSADFTNGDVTGDAAYERLEILAEEGRAKIRQLLDEDQVGTFQRFQGTLRSIMHQQIVHNELATLKSALGLDPEQEKKILSVVEQRYTRVGEKLTTPIPNVFFKPLRRESDAAIYDETAKEIRALLTDDQRARYDAWEENAPAAPLQYRSQLAPK